MTIFFAHISGLDEDKMIRYIVVNVSYSHKRPCNANTNFRDNRI